MDLSPGRRKLDPAEKVRRMREGLCYYCGGAGHMTSTCPNKRPLNASSLTAPVPTVSPPALNPPPPAPAVEEESKN
jgi:hypothetical protein